MRWLMMKIITYPKDALQTKDASERQFVDCNGELYERRRLPEVNVSINDKYAWKSVGNHFQHTWAEVFALRYKTRL